MAPRINIPPLTRGLLAALLAFSILNAAARYRSWSNDRTSTLYQGRQYYAPYLAIIPGSSILYPWVFATATFAEQNIVGLLITGATLFYGGRYLERAWGSREYALFVGIVAVLPNLVTFMSYVLLFAITKREELATTAISGGIAIQSSFLVSFKQLVPEHTVTIFRSLLRIRVKHLPALFLLLNTISGILLGTDTALILAWAGFFISWTYLRFYRVTPSLTSTSTGSATTSSSIRGDASETFSFAAFFPDAVQPPISAVADGVYNALVALRICTPFSAEDVDGANELAGARRGEGALPSLLNAGGFAAGTKGVGHVLGRGAPGSNGGGGGGGGRREEAERRRALALRALDQRLHAATTQKTVQHVTQPGETSPLAEGMQYEPEIPGVGGPASVKVDESSGEMDRPVQSGQAEGGQTVSGTGES